MNTFYCNLKYFLFVVFIGLSLALNAQYIDISTDEYPSFSIGPANTTSLANAYSRYAYIYPESMVSTLKHGDTITKLSFLRLNGGSFSGNANMKLYMRTTVNTSYTVRNINWVNQKSVTGMKKVYDDNPHSEMGSQAGWVTFTLTTPYVVDTILGKNFELLAEYEQGSAQNIPNGWASEYRGFSTHQTKYATTFNGFSFDTTQSTTIWHPSIRIHFPRYNNDARVEMVYSLGKLPIPLGNPDTVKAIVRNVGKKDLTNFKFYFESKGKNKHKDSININIIKGEEKLINMPNYSPTNLGLDTLVVKVANDDNNVMNAAQCYRICTENIYSYKDPTLPIAGGIGFNGTSGDFVAKFYSSSAKAINQINVSFSTSNIKFKLGIWKADGKNGAPKTNVWTSDSLYSSNNFTTPVLPPVAIDGSFYVGVRQVGNTNVGFGYQAEDPVRNNTFYYAAPMNDTNWVDFAPDAPFKFAIEPRIQTNNDVAPISLDNPIDTVKLTNLKTIAPKATILNYGALNQTTPFNVSMIIRRNNTVEYSSTKSDTLWSGSKRRITFDSTFLPTQSGDYDVMIITRLANDQMKDNDTIRRKIVVANYKDVGLGVIFDPAGGSIYEQFVDTIYPTIYVQNFGMDKQGPFDIVAEIYDENNNKIYAETTTATLTALNSVIKAFKEFPCSLKGNFKFVAYTKLNIDTDRRNDTAIRFFQIIRSNDVALTELYYPLNGVSLAPPVASKRPSVLMENLGGLNQGDDFPTYCRIYYGNTLIYADSVMLNSFRTIPSTLSFKNFKPTLKGYYTMKVFTDLPTDQYRANDTITSKFAVGVPDDVQVLAIAPVLNSALIVNQKYAPKVLVKNNGFNSQNTPFPVVFKVSKGLQTLYLDVKTTTIDSGDSKWITFDSTLVLTDTNKVNVLAYAILPNDFFKTNDTLKGWYNGKTLFDVSVSAIQYPVFTDTLMVNTVGIKPILTISNIGDSLVKTKFKTVCKITDIATNALIYQQGVDTFFTTYLPFNIEFPAISKQLKTMKVKVEAYTTLATDQDLSNDTAISLSQYELWYDAQPIEIKLPENAKIYDITNAPINPVVIIKNNGSKPFGITIAKMEIKKVVNNTETTVYSANQNTVLLLKNEMDTLTFAPFNISAQALGNYKTYVALYNKFGESDANDSLQNAFIINDKTSVNAIALAQLKVYPNPANDLFTIDLKDLAALPKIINVYDIDGKNIYQTSIINTKMLINTKTWASGTYILAVDDLRLKIVVQH